MQTKLIYQRTITVKKYMITKVVAVDKSSTESTQEAMSVAASNIPVNSK